MAFPNSALRRALLLSLVTLASPAPADDGRPLSVGPSGLPLPRFASLASSEVNVRTGPSMDHPIRWIYSRPGLPVRVVEESDVWRRIEDPDGETGWAHSSLLSVRRTVVILGPGVQELRRSTAEDGRIVARLEPGVVAEFERCQGEWCRIEVAEQRGWLPRAAIWGVTPRD